MKTTKFLAMLMAAFALAFSFASCGDDDDDTPNPSKSKSAPAVGELRVLDKSAKITWGMGYPVPSMHVKLRLTSNDPENPNQGNEADAEMMLDVRGVYTDAEGHIPTGTYPFIDDANNDELDQWDEGYHPCYILSGGIATSTNNGYGFVTIKGSSELKIERSGDIYTLTIKTLKLEVYIMETDDMKETTTSFTYKGKLDGLPFFQEEY